MQMRSWATSFKDNFPEIQQSIHRWPKDQNLCCWCNSKEIRIYEFSTTCKNIKHILVPDGQHLLLRTPIIEVFSFTGVTIFLIMKPNLAYGQISCSALYIAAYVPTSLGPFFVSQISTLRWIIVRTKIRECNEQEIIRKKIVVTLLILGLMYHAICFSIGLKHGLPLGILQQVKLIQLI